MFVTRLAAALCAASLSCPAAAQTCEDRRQAVMAHVDTFREMLAGAQAMQDVIHELTTGGALPPAVGQRLMDEGSLPMTAAILASRDRVTGEVEALFAACAG